MLGNSRALKANYNGVDKNTFKIINTCSNPKKAWETLEDAYKGIPRVCMSRLKLLATKLEKLNMEEEKTIYEFNV